MKILLTAGARPNFMKLSPIIREIKKRPEIEYLIVHTGQHYDDKMNDIFFRELDIPQPKYNLGVGSCSHALQTSKIMSEFEPICIKEKPDIVIVIGDVNSTLACALVSSKLHIKTAHIEAGLRSYDRTMPEEINRLVADSVSDYLFCTIPEAANNLKAENYSKERIFLVGDTMVDNLLYNINKINYNPYEGTKYILLTLHRDSNTDNEDRLTEILRAINSLSRNHKIIFPIHPRTKKKIDEFNLNKLLQYTIVLEPLGYLDFLTLVKYSQLIMTDSGGLQIEAASLHIPCITLRDTTEQIDTLRNDYNVLVGWDYHKIVNNVLFKTAKKFKPKKIYDKLKDGKASKRIIKALIGDKGYDLF